MSGKEEDGFAINQVVVHVLNGLRIFKLYACKQQILQMGDNHSFSSFHKRPMYPSQCDNVNMEVLSKLLLAVRLFPGKALHGNTISSPSKTLSLNRIYLIHFFCLPKMNALILSAIAASGLFALFFLVRILLVLSNRTHLFTVAISRHLLSLCL
jgi:hypothetical protein